MQAGISNIKKDLPEFEQKYSLTSIRFYEQFSAGELRDEEDYMLYAYFNNYISEYSVSKKDVKYTKGIYHRQNPISP